MNNYCYPTSVTYHEITNESVIINPKYGGYGIGYPYKVKPNTKYSISWSDGGNIGIGFYTSSGEYISHVYNDVSYPFTTPENCEVITVVLRPDTGKNTTYKSIQLEESTTPTSYEPYGYKIPVKVNGKNLFNINNVVSSSNVKNNNDGTLSVTPQATSSGVYASEPKTLRDYAPNLEVEKTYVLSANTTGTGNRIYLNITKRAWQFGKSLTLTEDDLNSAVVWYANGTDTSFTATISNIQIEEGTVATDYEPYIGSSTTNIYLDEPLRKVGNYADYIDFASGKVVRNVKETTLNGTENWSLYSGGYSFVVSIPDSIKKYQSSLSTHFKNVSYAWAATYNGKFDIYSDHDSVSNKYFRQPNGSVTTVARFKQWLESEITQGTPVRLVYTLASPIEQTMKLPQLYIPQGNVKISINSNGLDVPIEVSYYKK